MTCGLSFESGWIRPSRLGTVHHLKDDLAAIWHILRFRYFV